MVPESLIDLVMALYSDRRSRVRVLGNSFQIGAGVHLGSVLRPLLFILVMEETTGCRKSNKGQSWGSMSKWREISSLLVNRAIPLPQHGKVYETCIRSVMLYGGETWHLPGD